MGAMPDIMRRKMGNFNPPRGFSPDSSHRPRLNNASLSCGGEENRITGHLTSTGAIIYDDFFKFPFPRPIPYLRHL